MNSTLAPAPTCSLVEDRPAWPVAGLLLDALTRRDFAALQACLAPDVRFRALVPPGLLEFGDAPAVAAKFTAWFGGEDAFEVVDASVGQVGGKLYARWKVRMVAADGRARVAEQHVYTSGTHRIETLDLLCSGFHTEAVA
jgi:hypothetical protein